VRRRRRDEEGAVDPPPTTTTTTTTTSTTKEEEEEEEVLIALVGWHEGLDQWLPLSSPLLSPLNSRSFSSRGSGPLRAEMMAVADLSALRVLLKDEGDEGVVKEALGGGGGGGGSSSSGEGGGPNPNPSPMTSGPFAISRQNTWTSSLLLDHLNYIGSYDQHHGYHHLLTSLLHHITSSSSSGSSNRGGGKGFTLLSSFIMAIGRPSIVWSQPFLQSFVPLLQQALVESFERWSDDDLRFITR